MKLNAAYGLLVVAACRPAAGLAPEPARCMAGVPPSAQHPIATRSVALAGDYELTQVQTQPVRTVRSGRLHLALLDSAARVSATGGPVPDLVGWLEPAGGAAPRP
ncbi:MAG TPA: hypothetical protein VFU40_01630, partial [Gemmatimonadales bacterium]|nr:hypothetical protein [Gemmatimonadales bacterium]